MKKKLQYLRTAVFTPELKRMTLSL